MDKMLFFRKKYKLGKYPYIYECENCFNNDHFSHYELHKEIDEKLRKHYAIKSENPIYFYCTDCDLGILKPIGYNGKPSLIIKMNF